MRSFDLGEIGWLQNVAAIASICSASSVGSVLSQCMCFCVCVCVCGRLTDRLICRF